MSRKQQGASWGGRNVSHGSALFAHVSITDVYQITACHTTLCLLLSLLCVEPSEQCREKSRKMPSCSGSESKNSSMWSITNSGLDNRLEPEQVSSASTLEGGGELDTSESIQCVWSAGSGRMQE